MENIFFQRHLISHSHFKQYRVKQYRAKHLLRGKMHAGQTELPWLRIPVSMGSQRDNALYIGESLINVLWSQDRI